MQQGLIPERRESIASDDLPIPQDKVGYIQQPIRIR